MIIREAKEEEIPAIIEVLRLSLGETDLPLSEEIWRYKHIDNPFGRSLVLVAELDAKIVGVRALMRWEWQGGMKIFKALRAVDTATHPDYQGRGIFKKLTQTALEKARNDNFDFIFNTPNDKSRPGYLKMGWSVVGKVNVGIMLSFKSFWKFNPMPVKYQKDIDLTDHTIKKICNSWNKSLIHEKSIFTPKSGGFLHWRYEVNPLQDYQVKANEDFYIAAYIKKRGKIKELRISECLYKNRKSDFPYIKKIINKWALSYGVQVISFSPKFYTLGGISHKGYFGPVLTFLGLNLDDDLQEGLLEIENWNSSIGDLELF